MRGFHCFMNFAKHVFGAIRNFSGKKSRRKVAESTSLFMANGSGTCQRVSIGESLTAPLRAAPESVRCFGTVGGDRRGLSSWIPCRSAAVYRYRFRVISPDCFGICRAQCPYFARRGTFPALCAVIGQMYHVKLYPP